VGVVVSLKGLIDKGVRADDLLQDFKRHPAVAGLLEGGELAEYSAHLIPVSGIDMMPSRLYADGFMVAGDAAALVLGTGLALEGANFAVASGMAAAKTVITAKEKSDFSADSLSFYQELLEGDFVMKDLQTHRLAPHFLENERIYTAYPKLACNLAEKAFTSDGAPRRKTWELLKEEMKGNVSFVQMARDLLQAGRAV
jgi:electron transfer flavoprotein-quinone oxidoreductase